MTILLVLKYQAKGQNSAYRPTQLFSFYYALDIPKPRP